MMYTIRELILPAIKRKLNQEALIEYLYSIEFKFVDLEVAFISPQFIPIKRRLKVAEEHQNYSILVRKFPNGDIDTRLIVLIKLLGKKENQVGIYIRGKHDETLNLPWKQTHNFKTMKLGLEFPEYLNYDERRDWRLEHVKLLTGKKAKPSEFYLAHKDQVKILMPERYGEKF